ncbi:MAG: hypothetical protein JF565_09095 [Propionibacteriales bacterium]|nr:hypothetical protein [Propionibacteriales bacterium]
MDAAPRSFAELPRDAELGIPVPFACGTDSYGEQQGRPPAASLLDGRRVTQCALSRVCGICGSGLGRPLAFIGSPEEADRNAFHFPASHLSCARLLLDALADVTAPVIGQTEPIESWVLTTTAAFEYVRPGRDDLDRRPTFQPHEVLTETR